MSADALTRGEAMPALHIRPLSLATRDDFLRFIAGPAFADHPAWQGCYCQYPHTDHAVVRWDVQAADANRAGACERIERGAMQGLLAWRGDEVVGWCNAGPRALLPDLAREPLTPLTTPTPGLLPGQTGYISCFVVAAAHRRTGVARALLDAACAHLHAQGLTHVQARAPRHATSAAQMHAGPLALYLAAGFAVVAEGDDGEVTVQRALG